LVRESPFLRFPPSTEDNAECERNRPKRPSNQQLGRNGVEDDESGSQLADMFLSNRSLLEDSLKENIECRFVEMRPLQRSEKRAATAKRHYSSR